MNKVSEIYVDAWRKCKNQFKSLIKPDEFLMWIEPLDLYSFENGVLAISVPNNSCASYVDANFIPIIRPIIMEQFGGKVKNLKYIVIEKRPAETNTNIKNFLKETTPTQTSNPYVAPGLNKVEVDSQLNFDLTFDNFIEGDCNKLARAAGLSVAEKPGAEFNPMFIYGESGLGKTHIAQAIGIEVKKNFPNSNVLYVSSQKFIDQFTSATQKHEAGEFVRFYQMMDVLIVDDIQELAGKPQTQIVFFNIFNHLHQNKKQLVFTSDKSPVDLKDIENRLISRFKWALSVQLSAPDFETKVAIIKSKSKRYNIELSQEVIEFLADSIHTNVRELEGAVTSFAAHSALLQIPATIDLAHKVLTSYVANSKKEITIDYIKDIVCDFYKIKQEQFLSKTREREVALARQVAMFIAKEYTSLSLKCIGNAIGGRSHATVVHSCKTIDNLIETDKDFKNQIDQLKKSFR